jgi:hypothetical protein
MSPPHHIFPIKGEAFLGTQQNIFEACKSYLAFKIPFQ